MKDDDEFPSLEELFREGQKRNDIDPIRFIDDDEIEWGRTTYTKTEPQNKGEIKTVRREEQKTSSIDTTKFIDDDEIVWNKATHTRVEPQNKNEDGLKTLRNGIIALLIATAGYLAYNAGYNSDYAKHFWDDTKKTLEEKRVEESIRDSDLDIEQVSEEYGEDR